MINTVFICFNTIQYDIDLKLTAVWEKVANSFNTIQYDIDLKLHLNNIII